MITLRTLIALGGLALACTNAPEPKTVVDKAVAEAERIACYAEAASAAERTLKDLCPDPAVCPVDTGAEILKQLELRLEVCDGSST